MQQQCTGQGRGSCHQQVAGFTRHRTHVCRSLNALPSQQHPPPPAAATTAAANEAAAAADSISQLLQKRSYAPARYVGPVQVSRVPGKRFGLTATRNLSVGEVLLITPPLAVAFGPAGDAPANEVLVQQLEGGQLQPWQLQWLRALNRGSTAAAAAPASAGAHEQAQDGHMTIEQQKQQQDPPQQQQQGLQDGTGTTQDIAVAAAGAADSGGGQTSAPAAAEAEAKAEAELLPVLQQLLQGNDGGPDAAAVADTAPSATAAPATAAGNSTDPSPASATAAAQVISIASIRCPLTADELQQIVAENAYSEAAEDLGAALLRELEPEGLTGLWPEYALLNHSCVPNTLAVCVGQFLLLHVTAPVLQGEELTCSYLGSRAFSPVAVRRAYLQGVYGFHCCCGRCLAEQRTFPTQYYPADDAVLGLSGSNGGSNSGSNGSNGGSNGVAGVLAAGLRALQGLLQQQQPSKQQQQQQGTVGSAGPSTPNPSAQHRLLLQQYEAVLQELRPAVQALSTATNSRRQEQQLQLLGEVTDAVDGVFEEVAAAVAADSWCVKQGPAAATKWVLGAAYPLLQLQLELIELLLSSGELPVDESDVLDESTTTTATSSRNSSGSSSGSRAMAVAAGAAAARLALNRNNRGRSSSSSKRRRVSQGSKTLPGWLSGFWDSLISSSSGGSSGSSSDGPVTKRQLLGLYVEGLGRAVGVLDAVARGSEAHVVCCIQYLDALRRVVGGDAEAVALAEGMCGRAHAARYGVQRGPQGQALLARLISARRRQLLGASLARKMSVLAWEAANKS